LLKDCEITIATLTPSVLAALSPEQYPMLQTVITAGEECPINVVSRWSVGRRFFNAYGPTEATVWNTVAECTDGNRKPTIGCPIINTQVFILDQQLQPAPVGVPGELHIGGAGLARGYLNRPELTAEKFIRHPFSAAPEARLYKTGDLARYQPDGQIEFLGRVDEQVKLRGFRIELGEIEVVLCQHPDVHQARVIVREDAPGDKRLVAYVVPNPDAAPSPEELRRHVQVKLPAYMVPSHFVALDHIPLTQSNKLDRKALPTPDVTSLGLKADVSAPRTPTEKQLVDLWAEILGVDQIGIHADFFALGGHSLLATQILTRIRDIFEVDLPQSCVFKAPTIAQMAELIDGVSRPEELSREEIERLQSILFD